MICFAILVLIICIMAIAWAAYITHLGSCGWGPSIETSNIQITFSQFRVLYNNDPDKANWSLCDGYVLYIPLHAKIAFMRHRDYHKYDRFRKHIVKKSEEARKLELMLRITNQVRERVREKGNYGKNGKI